jgi:hypothetical protein
MTTTNPRTNFPDPAGAARVHDWELGRTAPDGGPNAYRGFTGTSWSIDRPDHDRDVTVTIEGLQQRR